MRRFAFVAAAVTLCLSLAARADDQDAKTLAQDILDKGSALFDKRDAAAMAATAVRYLGDLESSVLPEAPGLCRGARVVAWLFCRPRFFIYPAIRT